ncbi:MAG: AAA family ATPase [Candidatus Manganitrophaceae bacterium]|nr:MAG: AAA family ATPase [Candidatus Manganitrophaceae bacterium]
MGMNNRRKRLMSEFKSYLRAGYPALYVQTVEPDRAFETLGKEVLIVSGVPVCWDVISGIKEINGQRILENPDPLSALTWLTEASENTVLFLWNFHKFLNSIEVIQVIQNGMNEWKSRGKTLIVLAPQIQIPVELDRIFTVIEFNLPDREVLRFILSDVVGSSGLPMPEHVEALLDAATGLTTFEAENAFALCAIDPKPFSCSVVSAQKAQMVMKNTSLEISHATGRFDTLGGLDRLKEFALKIAGSPLARGLLLLGVPGCGKSHFAKVLGGELGIPTLSLDFGRLFGSLVGESEERVRQALSVADAMAPCILMLDEIDKGLSGANSSHQSDGGVGSRIFGTFLSWLNDHKSRVFVVATTNNIAHLPPEFLRAERWDAIFFVDLPTPEEREAILKIHAAEYGIEVDAVPDLSAWSGAEIRSLCRIAAMTKNTLSEAARYVVPLSRSMGEKLTELREWAKSRTLPASSPQKSSVSRRISAKPAEGGAN